MGEHFSGRRDLDLIYPSSEYKRARNLLKAGKTREGYQTTQTILDQATVAMDILDEDYLDEKHVLAYDNVTIHTARAPDALSAVSMTAKPSENFNKVKAPMTLHAVYACEMLPSGMELHNPFTCRTVVSGA
jgi:hypothetical protein